MGKKIYREYRYKLELEGHKRIDLVEDNTISTAAKMEFAENHNRENHIARFKTNYVAGEHLIMHELVHLDLVIQARKANKNQLFTSNQNHREQFKKDVESSLLKLKKRGVAEASIENFANGLFDGLNLQIFNTPIDVFIEHFLFNYYIELRPFQFVSLYTLLQEGIKAVTDKQLLELAPKEVISNSLIYNLVNALQFRDLYGVDLIWEFNPTPKELSTATSFYEEFLEYVDDKEPGEEYELVQHWAEDLKLESYFELIDEEEYRNKRLNVDNLLSSIEKDPFDVEREIPHKKREMETFQQSQQEIGTNMAVVTFMVDALAFFKRKSKEEIKRIAYEIAMLGTHGFSPEKKNYRLNCIPEKTFSGYHILAYYYVSWAIAVPEMLAQLQLPFENEYELAKTMQGEGK